MKMPSFSKSIELVYQSFADAVGETSLDFIGHGMY